MGEVVLVFAQILDNELLARRLGRTGMKSIAFVAYLRIARVRVSPRPR
jgi:hypothetical protein